jgi:hypothetical protein
VTNSHDVDSPYDHLVATEPGVGEVSGDEGETVGKHAEGLADGVRLGLSHAESTRSLLGSTGRSAPTVASLWQGTVDEVGEQALAAVVRGTLAEFDSAEQVSNRGHGAGYTAERSEILLGRLALIVGLQRVGVDRWVLIAIRSQLPLGSDLLLFVRWGGSTVSLAVLLLSSLRCDSHMVSLVAIRLGDTVPVQA